MNQPIDLLDVYRMLRDEWRWLVGITAAFAVASLLAGLALCTLAIKSVLEWRYGAAIAASRRH